MDWIKKNSEQFLLVLAAIGVLGVAILLIQRAQGFGERFAAAMAPGRPQKNVPPLTLEPVDAAKSTLEEPALWKPEATRAYLLVPDRYIIDPVKQAPVKLAAGGTIDSVSGRPIPFQWFLDNKLDPLAVNVTKEDPDKDGFVNEDEWRDQTDPSSKESHPPYTSKLFFKQWVKTKFRLQFMAVPGGDRRKGKKQDLDLQINPVDILGATQIVKVGDPVKGTDYKVIDYEFKEGRMTGTGEREEAPEVTVENVISGDKVVLPIGKIVESPESLGVFEYVWPTPPQTLQFKRGEQFALAPDPAKQYKLVDIKESEAVITLPSGENLTVRPDPRAKR